MPLWKIYHPENAFSDEDKKAISEKITAVYRGLPPFYVGVIYEPVPKSSFYVGGEPAEDFVRISVDHIARQFNDEETKLRFLNIITQIFNPYVADRGLRWEMHVDETPFSLWSIQGMRPPIPDTPESEKWRTENKPSPF